MPISEGKFLDLKKSSRTRKKNAVPIITRRFSIKSCIPDYNYNFLKKEEFDKYFPNNKPVINSSVSACEKSENNPIFEKLEIDAKIKLT
jgi:hypothetical protein